MEFKIHRDLIYKWPQKLSSQQILIFNYLEISTHMIFILAFHFPPPDQVSKPQSQQISTQINFTASNTIKNPSNCPKLLSNSPKIFQFTKKKLPIIKVFSFTTNFTQFPIARKRKTRLFLPMKFNRFYWKPIAKFFDYKINFARVSSNSKLWPFLGALND